ncbi:MAG TPA: DNA topoisomerase IB [Trueperaceae bacterium]
MLDDNRAGIEEAGLRYVNDNGPGISRRRRGKGFSYYRPDGERITDPDLIERLNSLAIPPAYKDVWICPDPNGHLQATGRDEKGRKQYIYHPRWQQLREKDKFDRLLSFAEVLPRIRRRVNRDLQREGMAREKVLAAVVKLLESTLARVGNSSYARENGSFGLTTIRKKHVELEDDTVVFEFRGKGGQEWHVETEDERIAEVVRQCVEIPGYELFKYIDEDGNRRDVESGHVNEYLRQVSEEEVTAKDFRTWAGTVLCAEELCGYEFETERQAKKNVVAAVKSVSSVLGNTPAVCRQSYVHPVVIDTYLEGELRERLRGRNDGGDLKPPGGLRSSEAAVWRLLREKQAS